MDLGIAGKTALVTGGSRGLGRQCALSLATEGVNVAICGRTQESLDGTAAELTDLGVEAIAIVADVSDASTTPGLHAEVADKLGEIDILVNNVGGSQAKGNPAETPLLDFKATFDLNLFGGYELMRLVIPHMREQKWGRIINIASIWGRAGRQRLIHGREGRANRDYEEHRYRAGEGWRAGKQRGTRLHRACGRELGALQARQLAGVRTGLHRPEPADGQVWMAGARRRPGRVPVFGPRRTHYRLMYRRGRRPELLDDLAPRTAGF